MKRSLLFLVDGARPDVLAEELNLGRLSNLARYFAESGTHQTALSCFPSTTGPAYLPYITGCFPGTCNVPGIRWFDKPHYAKHGWGFQSFRSYCGLEANKLNADIHPQIKTAYDLFPNAKSIFNGVSRGVLSKNDLTKHSRIWYYYYAHLTDRWSFIDNAAHRLLKKSIQKKRF